MSQYLEQKDLFDKILHLKTEERQDPLLVLESFFSDYRLHECRHHLWTMVETCLTTENAEFSDAGERGNLLLHFRDLERLLEAGALLLEKYGRKPGPSVCPSKGKGHPKSETTGYPEN
ncbi:MAG TPA: hypothetical protein VFE32_05505 [Puia sp.]|jgi:hypothetical protein|nr:hypothetical protein [Puia sp.]